MASKPKASSSRKKSASTPVTPSAPKATKHIVDAYLEDYVELAVELRDALTLLSSWKQDDLSRGRLTRTMTGTEAQRLRLKRSQIDHLVLLSMAKHPILDNVLVHIMERPSRWWRPDEIDVEFTWYSDWKNPSRLFLY